MVAYNPVRSNAVFGILLFMFAAILIFLFLVEPEVREETLPAYVTSFEKKLFDVSPGVLEAGSASSGLKTIHLADVNLDNTPQHTELDISRDASFSTSLFSNEVYDFGFSINMEDVRAAGLKFTVYDLDGDGEVNVYINGKNAFARAVGIGHQVQVDFPLSYLKDGANRVEITAAHPGFTFWRKNSITLLDLVLFTDEYNTETAASNQAFSLSDSEFESMKDATLKAYIIRNSEPADVEIQLNGQSLIKATLPEKELELDVPTSAFRSGANILSWSVEQGGRYSVRFANLLLDTKEDAGKTATYLFTISESRWEKIDSGNYDCLLELVKEEDGDDSINVEINFRTDEYDFVDDKIAVDICSRLEQGQNKIIFAAVDDGLDLSRAKLTIKNKEE